MFKAKSADLVEQIKMMKERIFKNGSDMRIEVDQLKELVGVGSNGMTAKNNLFATNKLLEVIMQYLMVDRMGLVHSASHKRLPAPGDARPNELMQPDLKSYTTLVKCRQLASKMLEEAWLMFQEMNNVQDPVETVTVKQMKKLYRGKRATAV